MKRQFTSTCGRVTMILITAMAMLVFASSASATPPTPPFTQCPPVGLDTSCHTLIVVNSSGELEAFNDPSQPPFDGVEDTMIGVENKSSASVSSIALEGEFIFGFDGDGICAGFYVPGPPCTWPHPTSYEGPETSFTITNVNEGSVNFTGGLAAGTSTYFSLEGPVSCASVGGKLKCGAKPKHPTETTVKCEPQPVVAGQSTTCTATVTDTSSEPTTPTGTVSFESSGKGSFSPTSCELKAASSSSATCSVTYTPGATPSEPTRKDTITATYGGDETHEGSKGTTTVTVMSCVTNPPKVNVRWHYSANGSAGSWSVTREATCGKTITIGPQAMEGDLKVSPGKPIKAGYSFTLPNNKSPFTVTFTNGKVVFKVQCASGAKPSKSTFEINFPNQSYLVTNQNWYPSGEQSSPLVYQGETAAPPLCGTGQLRLKEGGTFSALVTVS
jgi:hypothetical protein